MATLAFSTLLHSSDKDVQTSPYQHYYNTLEIQLEALEARNPVANKVLSAGLVFVLDMALELTHAWALQNYGTDFFYQRPLTGPIGLEHTTQDLLRYTLNQGHVPALMMSAAVWLSENLTSLPSLHTQDSLIQIAVIAGSMAGGYGMLFHHMLNQGRHGDHTNITAHPMLKRLEPSGRPWFMAAARLNTMKHLLQAAGIATMITTSYLRRAQKMVEVRDIRNSLFMARERLRRESQKAADTLLPSATFPELPDFAKPGLERRLRKEIIQSSLNPTNIY